ncbi:MAG: CRISPR-associated endonuclease Cas1, partial [Methanomassiliicoccales archaeon]
MEEVLIPARMVNEYVYCPRLCYIEWVQGDFIDSVDTVEGKFQHRNVDKESASWDQDLKVVRSLMLTAPEARLSGKIDLLELEGQKAVPIDYKKGFVPDVPEGAYEPEIMQICALAAILRENGYECDKGVIYYVSSKKRVDIEITEDRMKKLKEIVSNILTLPLLDKAPEPLKDSPKCPRCSLVSVCLPDETNFLKGESGEEPRRLIPARDDFIPLYVTTDGAIVRKREGRLEVIKDDQFLADLPLHDVSQVCIYGGASITSPAVNELLQRGIPISHFTRGGYFLGITTGVFNNNVNLHLAQYSAVLDQKLSLSLARSFVEGKIRNQRTMLRRNDKSIEEGDLEQLQKLARSARDANDIEELLGIEGCAAQIYFNRFSKMIKCPLADTFHSRNKRPPKDPINAVLSYLYGVMVKEWFVVLLQVGFNPLLGFYHKPRHGKPSLALDMMEEFRPLIADSVTITLFNNGELDEKDFIVTKEGTGLKPDCKKKIIRGYERRMNTEITHPVFGYSISYR